MDLLFSRTGLNLGPYKCSTMELYLHIPPARLAVFLDNVLKIPSFSPPEITDRCPVLGQRYCVRKCPRNALVEPKE